MRKLRRKSLLRKNNKRPDKAVDMNIVYDQNPVAEEVQVAGLFDDPYRYFFGPPKKKGPTDQEIMDYLEKQKRAVLIPIEQKKKVKKPLPKKFPIEQPELLPEYKGPASPFVEKEAHLFNLTRAIYFAEWGKTEFDKYQFTSVGRQNIKGKSLVSSAFGPGQLTTSTVYDLFGEGQIKNKKNGRYLNTWFKKEDEGFKNYVRKFIKQGQQRIKYAISKDRDKAVPASAITDKTKRPQQIEAYHKNFGALGEGNMPTEEHKKYYDRLMEYVLRDKIKVANSPSIKKKYPNLNSVERLFRLYGPNDPKAKGYSTYVPKAYDYYLREAATR